MQRAAEMIPLASVENWTLYERADKSGAQWRSLKLVRKGNAPKNNWWLGWNGERIARNHDAGNLAEHNPEIMQWVIDSLKAETADPFEVLLAEEVDVVLELKRV